MDKKLNLNQVQISRTQVKKAKVRQDKWIRLKFEADRVYALQKIEADKWYALQINAIANDYFRARLAVGRVN